MTIIICDKCEKETSVSHEITLEVKMSVDKRYDLCPDCATALRVWLGEKK